MSKYFVRYAYNKPERKIVGGVVNSFATVYNKAEDFAIINIPDDEISCSEVLKRVHIDELDNDSNINYWDIDILVLNKL